jgi:Glycosyl transferase family 2
MSATPLVSILICSYNYERFVGQTIESALRQTWPRVEVIVVDDGSTDGSWAVITSFGDRIKAIHQVNGGQGAAYNTCFANSSGDWLIFLDCDDLLDDDCVARCMRQARDGVNKVAFALRVIDAEGSDSGNVIPYTMHTGDVRPILRTFGHYGGPPGSGNWYRRSVLEKYFPLDTAAWPMCADTVPYVVSACHGDVAAVQEPCGSYRVHKRINKALGLFGNVLGSLVDTLVLDDRRRRQAMEMVRAELPFAVPDPLMPTPTQARTRLISWKINPAGHPYPGDRALPLIGLAWRSARHWPGFGWLDQLALITWATVLLAAPKPLASTLVSLNASDVAKRRLRSLSPTKRAPVGSLPR